MGILELATQMQWPFAMVCMTFCVSCGLIYVVRRAINARELASENKRLSSEVYRLTRSSVRPSEE